MNLNLDLNQFEVKKRDSSDKSKKLSSSLNLSQLDSSSKHQRKQEVLLGIERLPTLPKVVHEVIRLTNDSKSCGDDFVSLFSNEQTLTAKMLRMVNSPFYGFRFKVTTIPKAIRILGHKSLRSLVLASSCSRLFQTASVEYGYPENGLWVHSVTVAQLASYLAKNRMKFSADTADELFVVGLLHDIGKILLARELSKYSDECVKFMVDSETLDVTEMEREVLGIDHCEVGGVIISRWKIGSAIEDLINSHHGHHHENKNCRAALYSAVLSFADFLCDEMKVGIDKDCRWVDSIPDSLVETLGLDDQALEQIREETLVIIGETEELIAAMR